MARAPARRCAFFLRYKRSTALTVLQIFLSVRVLPTAHVAPEERYVVNAVPAVDGFYSCTYYLGFRDDFDVRVPALVAKIAGIEAGRPEVAQMVRTCGARATHIVPHNHVVSRAIGTGVFGRGATFVRRLLVEGVYRHIGERAPCARVHGKLTTIQRRCSLRQRIGFTLRTRSSVSA
jgi:KUP system potassium uptake protein